MKSQIELAKSILEANGYKVEKLESLHESLSRYAQTDEQEEVLRFIEDTANSLGISLRYGTSVGMRPQTIILDYKYQDSIIRVNSNGSCEINSQEVGSYKDDYFDLRDYESEIEDAIRSIKSDSSVSENHEGPSPHPQTDDENDDSPRSPSEELALEFLSYEKEYLSLSNQELLELVRNKKLNSNSPQDIALAAAFEAANLHRRTEVSGMHWTEAIKKLTGLHIREIRSTLSESAEKKLRDPNYLNEAKAKKPKYWDSMFTANVIDAYKKKELTLDNIEEWETKYNGGRKPNPSLGTKEILNYHIATNEDPRES